MLIKQVPEASTELRYLTMVYNVIRLLRSIAIYLFI